MLILTVSNRNRRSPPPPHPECLCKSKAGDGFYINKWCEHAKFLWLRSGRGFSKKAGSGMAGEEGFLQSCPRMGGRMGVCARAGDPLHGWVLRSGCCPRGCCPAAPLPIPLRACPRLARVQQRAGLEHFFFSLFFGWVFWFFFIVSF